jgi:DNA-binding CsgD family transcriptional regulator
MSPLPPVPPDAAFHARLHAPLLALHAALEVEALWKAVQAVLRAACPSHRVTLFLGHLGHGEARLVRTDPPIARLNDWYSARGRINPFSAFIDGHPGRRFYRFSEVLPPRARFVRGEFYRRFARPEGWDKGVSVLFWERREMRAMFSLYRAPAEPDFSEEEMARLQYLYPSIETAIVRVQRLHTERLARRSLEEFARNIPVGLVLLDWELRVEFANSEAKRACAEWNFGAAGARSFNAGDVFAVPPGVIERCGELRAALLARDAKQLVSRPGDTARVEHPERPGHHAQITVLDSPGSALAKPRFLVVLETRPATAAGAARADRLQQIHELSPSEREIVRHVCAGESNAEIARRLNKSILTVKTQLNSVFRKTGVKSRAQLISSLL